MIFKSEDILTEEYLSITFWDLKKISVITIAYDGNKELFYLFDFLKIWVRKKGRK